MNNVFQIGNTILDNILKNGYSIKEDEDIILSEMTMADGTKRQNIAEKKKTIVRIRFTKINSETLATYLTLMENDFEATYYSPKYKINKTATFRLSEKPDIEMIGSYIDLFEEFEIQLESV